MNTAISCPNCKNPINPNNNNIKCQSCFAEFSWEELNRKWNIDVGDFYDVDDTFISYILEPEWENFETYLRFTWDIPFLLTQWQDARIYSDEFPYPIGAVGKS